MFSACDTTPTFVSALEGPGIDAGGNIDAAPEPDSNTGLCGNNVLDPMELCDPGVDLCCNSTCDGLLGPARECRPALGLCDTAEFCDGFVPFCPPDFVAPDFTECRPSSGDQCDVAEFCDGFSGACPEDSVAEMVCGDGFICGAETCDEGVFPPQPADGCDTSCIVEFGFICEGEPSVCDFSPVFAGELVINEIQKDPEAVEDIAGEWFELYNPLPNQLNLLGIEISDAMGESFVIDQSLFIPADGYFVLGNNGDGTTNGGVAIDFVYTGFTLDADDVIFVTNLQEQVLIDQVNYDTGDYPNLPGSSLSLEASFRFEEMGNDFGTNWCEAITAIGSGDFGTPGTLNLCTLP